MTNSSVSRLRGIMPPMTMPFDESGELVLDAIKPQIDYLLECGVHGIVAGGSIGEGYTLTSDELRRVMDAVCRAVDGRVPVVAGLIVNSTREAISRARDMAAAGVDALQVTPVHYLFRPTEAGTLAHFHVPLPILIYNVIPWNYLSIPLMQKIMAEIPGVIGMKQSGGDLKSVSDLVQNRLPGKIVFSGVDALLYPAFAMGADGAISAMNAALPAHSVRLWNAVQSGRTAEALDLHWQINRLWNTLVHDDLPVTVKYIQSRLAKTQLYHGRAPLERLSEQRKRAIDDVLDQMQRA